MKKLYSLFLIFFMLIETYGQLKIDWMRDFGAAPSTSASIKKTLTDSNGNIYTLGNFSFYSNFIDNTTNNAIIINGDNSYVAKYNSAGQLQWVNNFGGQAEDFTLNSSEDVIVTGGFTQSILFNDGTTITATIPNAVQSFTIKLNKNSGNYAWKNTLPNGQNEYSPSYSACVTTLTDDSVIIGNNYIGNYNSPRLQLIKLDKNGVVVTVKPFNDPYKNGYNFTSLKSDNSNNIYVGGSFYYDIDVSVNGGQYNLVDPSKNNSLTAFIAKYDSNFNIQWAKAIGAKGADQVIAMEVDKVTQKSYVSIVISGNCDLNNGSSPAMVTNLWQQADTGVLAVYDGSGQIQYHHAYTGAGFNVGRGVIKFIQKQGNRLVLSGDIYNNPDIDISMGQLFAPSPLINNKMSDFVSVFQVNNNTFTLDSNHFFEVDQNHPSATISGILNYDYTKIILAGTAKSLFPYQGTQILPSSPTYSAFLISTNLKMLDNKEFKDLGESIVLANNNNSVKIICKNLILNNQIINIEGRKMYEGKSTEIDISSYTNGMYIMKISTLDGIFYKKFIK